MNVRVGLSRSREESRTRTQPYRIDPRWVAGGIAVTALFAIADVGRTWYWFPQRIPVHTAVYSLTIGSVYVAWVAIGIFIGWFRLRLSERHLRPVAEWSLHAVTSLAVGLVHLLGNTVIVWLLYSPTIPSLSFATVYLEKIIGWLPYEVLAYWGILAVFALFALRRERSEPRDGPRYQRRLSARAGDRTVIIDCADIDWIEAMDNYVLVTTRGRQHIVNDTMARLESALDPACFQRIHRSAIVNLERIDRLENAGNGGLEVVMKAGRALPVSRRRRAALRNVVAG